MNSITADQLRVTRVHRRLFFEGSRTYYNAAKLFPKNVRQKVTLLYAFVRKVDNIVDSMAQDRAAFDRYYLEYKKFWQQADIPTYEDTEPVLAGFIQLGKLCAFETEWIESFFRSMELDFTKRTYNSLDETIEYMYGSAEVIGLFMVRIMELPDDALDGAKMLGRAMQYLNFLRDIKEDAKFGRCYLPLTNTSFRSLREEETRKHKGEFELFMQREIKRCFRWQEEADAAFSYLPRNYRIAIRTAADMYLWTARQIYKNPWLVYEGSLKPSKPRIIMQAVGNIVRGGRPGQFVYEGNLR